MSGRLAAPLNGEEYRRGARRITFGGSGIRFGPGHSGTVALHGCSGRALDPNGLAIMGDLSRNAQALADCQQYRALLAVAEAIVSHRDLQALFHDLAGRLHLVVRFDYLACVLHDATGNTMPLHILETTEPIPVPAPG